MCRGNIFRQKHTANNLRVMFLDVIVGMESQKLRFWTMSKRKEGTEYVFSV